MTSKLENTAENPQEDKTMPLMEHLIELRARLLKSLIFVVLVFFVCLYFSKNLIEFFKKPLTQTLGPNVSDLHFTGPLDVFLTGIKVSLLSSIVIAAPFWIYQFWKFVEPALYNKEKKYIKPFILFSQLLFLAGTLFSYKLILPLTLDFLIQMGLEVGTPMITFKDYFSMLTLMIFGFGIIFEAPLVLVLLGYLDLVNSKLLKQYRRVVVVLVLIIGAIMTPPDPLSQIGMAIPLYVMYEISIILISQIEKKRNPSLLPTQEAQA